MNIRPAKLQDIPVILDIYATARAFMRAHDNPTQWNNGYPAQTLLESDIAKEQLFVCEHEGRLCGVFAFILGDDPTYRIIENGAWPNDAPYGTIHRIASDGTCKGLLAATTEFALQHCDNLRADTHADNKVMQNALTRLGYGYCGIIYIADGSPRLAYQLIK